MTEATLIVSFDFNALHRAFSARIGRVLERAALALTAVDQNAEHTGLVPNVVGPAMAIKLRPRAPDEVRPETAAWIVGCALRDFLEETSNLLEETRRMCAALTFSGRERVPEAELYAAVEGQRDAFDRFTFPRKVEYLREQYGDVLDARIEHVETLVRARNCLVHRLGMVAQRDCNDGAQLVVRWRAFELHVREPGGREFPVTVGKTLEAGGELFMRHGPAERRFSIGDRVAFNTDDLCGIWMTLHYFAVGMAQRVVNFAKSKGMVFDEPEQPEQPRTEEPDALPG
jgi:hypothetical protein